MGRYTRVGHDCPKFVAVCCVMERSLNGSAPKYSEYTSSEYCASPSAFLLSVVVFIEPRTEAASLPAEGPDPYSPTPAPPDFTRLTQSGGSVLANEVTSIGGFSR